MDGPHPVGEPVRLDIPAPDGIILGDMLRALLILAFGLVIIAALSAALRPSGGIETASIAANQPAGPSTKPHSLAPRKVAEQAGAMPRLAELRLDPDAEPPPGIVTRKVRDVTPAGVTAAPAATAPLTRVETPEAPKAAPQPRVERLFNPVVTTAGSIKTRGADIRLAGIDAPEFNARCGEGASAWPCGRMARAALRRFIRGRAIECDVPPEAGTMPDPATCKVAGENLSEWLVAQGWAKRSGEAYAGLEAAARKGKLGLWGVGRPDGYEDIAASSP